MSVGEASVSEQAGRGTKSRHLQNGHGTVPRQNGRDLCQGVPHFSVISSAA